MRRKPVEQLFHMFIEFFDVFVGVVREHIAIRSAPDQLLGSRVKDVENQTADSVVFNGCSSLTESPKAAPPPPAAIAVINVLSVCWLWVVSIATIAASPPDGTSIQPFEERAAFTAVLMRWTIRGLRVLTFSQDYVLHWLKFTLRS